MQSKRRTVGGWSESGHTAAGLLFAWLEAGLDYLLPRQCVACGLPSTLENLCRHCKAELPRMLQACQQCGQALFVSGDRRCGSCLRNPPPWESATAALAYRFPVDQLVCRFKFRRDLACGQVLGTELLAAIIQRASPLAQVIVPVPLHRRRQLSRSFNQAERLARQVSGGLHIPVRPGLLSRPRRTSAQSGLDASERKRNIRGAFSCQRIHYQHVALVDDVMTTGATLAECARVLKRAGAGRVSVWVAARADFRA